MKDSILQKPASNLLKSIKIIISIAILFLLLFAFSAGIRATSDLSLTRQKENLENAIRSSAVHSYALHGRYPESLEEILEDYHISYDDSRFLVEYVPTISNQLPQISVLSISKNS